MDSRREPPPAVPEPEGVRAEFVGLWSRLAPFWGISSGAARLYGGLLSRATAASAEELMEELGMSRGAVSMAARELSEWGLLLPERETGSRRLRYAAEGDLERAIRAIVRTRKRREWDPLLEHLRAWIPRLEAQRSEEARALCQRLRTIEGVVALADSMASAFLSGGMVQKLGLQALVAAARRRGSRRTPSSTP